MLEFLITRKCAHKAASKVLHQAGNLVWKPGHVVLANVGHHDIRQVVARFGGLSTIRCCHGGARNVFRKVCNFHELVLHMGCLCCAVVITDGGSCAKHDIAQTSLADVRASVVGGETLHESSRELNLTIHEDPLCGHDDIVKADNCLLSTKVWVALVDPRVATLHRAKVAALAAIDVGESGGIHRDGAGNGIILFRRFQACAGHDKHPMRVECAGLVHFCTAENHAAVFLAPHNVHKEVWVILLRWCLVAVTLWVGHGAADHVVVLLHLHDELAEALVILRAKLLVDLEGRGPGGIDGIHPNATLEAAAAPAAKLALHL
mmetsp:Transcript_4388/g.8538  ORF Transcript_4388/g.8538 Transcript_4388/m.8538 type:complete len:319 (+) Transcript_4388:191-1147(+)